MDMVVEMVEGGTLEEVYRGRSVRPNIEIKYLCRV